MEHDRRNPYVILGIPFGSSEASARAGFARMTLRLRTPIDSRYTMEDLTWALHEIEQILVDPELAFHTYRIPADPSAFDDSTEGVFAPAVERLPRATLAPTMEELAALRRQALVDRIRVLAARATDSIDWTSPYSTYDEVNTRV